MEDLVQTLVTGFLVSVLFIVIAWWFWRRYDQPSETQLAREEQLAKKTEEQQMWRAVEAQMAQEKAEFENQAIYLRKKAAEHERAQPPAAGALTNALDAFGGYEPATAPAASPDGATFTGTASAPAQGAEIEPTDFEQENDQDLLLAAAPIEVRQDKGVQAIEAEGAVEPDWALVEKLEQLSKTEVVEETPHPDLPEAPDLDALVTPEPLMEVDPEDVVEWVSEVEEHDEGAWDVEWSVAPDEEE